MRFETGVNFDAGQSEPRSPDDEEGEVAPRQLFGRTNAI